MVVLASAAGFDYDLRDVVYVSWRTLPKGDAALPAMSLRSLQQAGSR